MFFLHPLARSLYWLLGTSVRKSHHKSDRAYLHWLQMDVQSKYHLRMWTGAHMGSVHYLLVVLLWSGQERSLKKGEHPQ
jgi:hypothetical protein